MRRQRQVTFGMLVVAAFLLSGCEDLIFELALPQKSFIGTSVQLDATILNPGIDRTGDLYLVIGLPLAMATQLGCDSSDRPILFPLQNNITKCLADIRSDPTTLQADVASITLPGPLTKTDITNLITFDVPESFLGGIYTFFLFLTPPGAFADGSIDVSDFIAGDMDSFVLTK